MSWPHECGRIIGTVHNRARLRDQGSAREILGGYLWPGEVQATILTDPATGHAYLTISGFDWPEACRIPDDVSREEFEPSDDADDFEQFLRELAPCLAEPLTVQAVGSEKLLLPLTACEWYVRP